MVCTGRLCSKADKALLSALAAQQAIQSIKQKDRPSESISGCEYCQVALRKKGSCWTLWHSQA